MEKIVYVMNYKGIITITRTNTGIWRYNFIIQNLVNYINKKRKREGEKSLNLGIIEDMFIVGQILGYWVHKLTEKSKESYGDK